MSTPTEQAKLGHLAPPDARRDAVHVAIVAVVAGEPLAMGEWVVMRDGLAYQADRPTDAIGRADPFYTHPVREGERFWLCLRPGTITGLRHHWLHPAFPDEEAPMSEKEKSEEWLKGAAADAGVDYETMMEYVASDDYINMGQNEAYKGIDCGLFAKHVKIVTGKENAYPPFSCSC